LKYSAKKKQKKTQVFDLKIVSILLKGQSHEKVGDIRVWDIRQGPMLISNSIGPP
jgi:hypothetical protein